MVISRILQRAASGYAPGSPPQYPADWVTRSGTALYLNGQQWRGAGINWHWAGLRESNLQYPSHAQIDSVLDEAVSMDARVIRAHTLGISAGSANQLVTAIAADGALTWNSAAWEPIDYVIAGCRSRGIRLWVPFTDIANYYHHGRGWWIEQAFAHQAQSNIPSTYTYNDGNTTETGVTSYSTQSGGFSGNARDKAIQQQFYHNAWIRNAFMNNYVKGWFQHVNQYSGVAHKDEPMVAFAQGGNELWDSGDKWPDHAGADGLAWSAQFSAAVKSVSPYCLVVDSTGADGIDLNYASGRNDPNTDMFDYHLYNGGQTIEAGYITNLAATANSFGKVQVFGEYPFTNGGIATALSEMESTSNVGFGLFWAIYTTDENHVSGSVDDTVYVVGQNGAWKTQFQAHAAAMNQGTPPPPPPPPTNILASASVANCNATASAYASGSVDSADPVLAMDGTNGVDGSGSLQATLTGSGHKWMYIANTADMAPVTAGQTYTMSAHVQLVSGTPSSGLYGHLTWFNASGTYLGGDTSSGTTNTSGSYTQVTYTATAPANAAYAAPQIEIDGPSSGAVVLRIDQWGVFTGSSAYPWSSP